MRPAFPFVLPKRDELDGPVGATWIGDVLSLHVQQGQLDTNIQSSRYNALRLLGCMCLMLGVPVPRELEKLKM
jgi:hypothetical protein